MIITKFNSYLEKHSKATYLVLCIFIAVVFVFTIGSGDFGCNSDGRLTSIGSMYGRNLATADVMRKGSQLRLLAELQGRRLPAGNDTYALIQMTLEKMRLVHSAKEQNLDAISDDDLATFVSELPYWRTADKDRTGNALDSAETTFTQQRFKTFMANVVKARYGLSGADFDEMIKDEILAQRVLKKVTDAVKADENTVKTIAAVSTLKLATYPLNLEGDTRPAPAAIDAFLKDRSGELTEQDKMTNFYLIAYHTPEDIADSADRQDALKDVRVPEADVKAAFDKEAATTYKDKKFDDVKADIARKLRLAKAEPWLKKTMKAFAEAAAKPLQAKETVFVRFRADAQKLGLRLANQNGLPENEFVAGFDLPQKALVAAIRELKTVDKPSAIIALEGEEGPSGLAMVVKVNNPNRDNNIRNAAINILRGEEALKLFDEKIKKVYEPKLVNVKAIDEFVAQQSQTEQTESFTDPSSFIAGVSAMEGVTNIAFTFFKEDKEAGKVTIPVPDKRDAQLLNWYKREVAMKAAEKRASDALTALKEALKSGKTLEQADAQKKFIDVKQPVSWFDAVNSTMNLVYQQMMYSQGRVTPAMLRNVQFWGMNMAATQMGVSVKNFPELITALDKAGDKALLDQPVAGNNGFFLVYQVSRALPADGDKAKNVEAARNMVLNDLQAKAVDAFKAELLAASNTRLVEEVMPTREAK